MRLKISTEQQLILNLLKGDLPAHLDNIDTSELYIQFQRHRLFPLSSGIIELLNDQDREKWQNTIRTRTVKSLHQTSVLSKIINGFKKEGIEAIPLKGPVLTQSLYGNLGSRHFVDLDILVREVNIKRILKVAEGVGFSLKFPKADLTSKQWAYYFKYKKDIGLASREQGVFVELHTSIDNHELLNLKEEKRFWENLSSEKIGDTLFHCMNHESTFLYLAYHGGLHQYTRVFWLRDVAAALESWNLDHQKIQIDALKLGIGRLLGVSLELASEFFNAEIPSVYQSYLNEDKKVIRRLKHLCITRILGAESLSFGDRFRRQHYIYLLKPDISYKWVVIRSIYHRWFIGKFLGGH